MEASVLDRARAGDEHAFRELTEPHRRELVVHCYRMLGSLTEAEDTVQETLLAAWRGLAGFEQRASVRSWLYRIATNRCLNAMRAASRRVVTEPVPPFQPPQPSRRGEITWLQPLPDSMLEGVADTGPGPGARYQATESVELAFVAALQRMPPRQTAALLLRDVLGFAADEVAGMLGTSQTAVKGVLQRARAALERDRGPHGAPASAASAASAGAHEVGRRFALAYTSGDIDGVVALLTDDAWLSMPPAPHEYQGHAAIAEFLRASLGYRGNRVVRLLPARANTQPAFGSYVAPAPDAVATPGGLFVLTVAGDRLRAVTRFHLDELYPRFGLPDHLEPEARGTGSSRMITRT